MTEDDDIRPEQFAADRLDVPLADLPEEEMVFLGVADGSAVDSGDGTDNSPGDSGGSKWEETNGHLTPKEKDGIEVGEVESPESGDLNVDSSEDLVLSISGGQGAVRIETDSGHEIVLDDESGSESITVKDKTGNNRVEMDSASGEISISAQTKITMDAPEIELSADATVDIDSTGPIDIDGSLISLN